MRKMMLSVVPAGPLSAGRPVRETLHLVVRDTLRYNMFRMTNMKFPGRKAFPDECFGVSQITTPLANLMSRYSGGLPATTDKAQPRPGRSTRLKTAFTCFIVTLYGSQANRLNAYNARISPEV